MENDVFTYNADNTIDVTDINPFATVNVDVKKMTLNELPKYESLFAAGADIRADLWNIQEKFLFKSVILHNEDGTISSIVIRPGGRALIPTGLYLNIPKGFEVQIRSRSGLALKNGVFVLNSPGTIDSDYKNEIGVILCNLGDENFEVMQGDRIAQMLLKPTWQINWVEVEQLNITNDRGGGFGSTNIK